MKCHEGAHVCCVLTQVRLFTSGAHAGADNGPWEKLGAPSDLTQPQRKVSSNQRQGLSVRKYPTLPELTTSEISSAFPGLFPSR